MPTNYDAIAEHYRRAKLQPWRSFIESFTLLGLIGDLTGLIEAIRDEGIFQP
jgi:hypothetical protein